MRLFRVSRARRFSVSVLLVALASPAAALAQTDEQRAAARELALEGIGAYEAGKDAEAVDRLKRAQALVHAPTHLLYLGRAHARLGQYVRAREAYHRILRDGLAPGSPRAFRDARDAAEKEIAEVEEKIARITIRLENAPEDLATVRVTLDGTAVPSVLLGVPQPVDPGEHRIEASAPGLRAEPKDVALAAQQKGEVVLVLTPDGSPAMPASPSAPARTGEAGGSILVHDDRASGGSSGLRIAGYSALGLAAVGVGAGTLFLLQGRAKRADADAICREPGGICPPERRAEIEALDNDADKAMTLSVVSYIVGGASVAAGVALLIAGAESDESAGLTPFITLDRVGVFGRF